MHSATSFVNPFRGHAFAWPTGVATAGAALPAPTVAGAPIGATDDGIPVAGRGGMPSEAPAVIAGRGPPSPPTGARAGGLPPLTGGLAPGCL